MVRLLKKTHFGKKVIIGTQQNRGLVFLVNSKGHVVRAFTTDQAKELGLVTSSTRRKRDDFFGNWF